MASKTESKESNLVSSSMMLVNSHVSENVSMYYPESSVATQSSSSASSGTSDYPFVYQESTGPFSYGTYYPYSYSATDHVSTSSRNCRCEIRPVQETFLHQILTGKGYKNDRLYIMARPVIKQERDYGSYGCCYGYSGYYGYPMYY